MLTRIIHVLMTIIIIMVILKILMPSILVIVILVEVGVVVVVVSLLLLLLLLLQLLNPSNAETNFMQNLSTKRLSKNHLNPCIHWMALVKYSQMNTHVSGFQPFFKAFMHQFVLVKFVTSNRRVKMILMIILDVVEVVVSLLLLLLLLLLP